MIEYDEDTRIDLKTRNMLSMIEIVISQIGDSAKAVVVKPGLMKAFMRDLVEFNRKLKGYKEMKDEG